MKKLLFTLSLLTTSLLFAQDSLEQQVRTFLQPFHPNCEIAMAVIKGKQVEYIGLKKHKSTVEKVDNSQQIFEIGSITKVFTAQLLAQAIADKIVKPTTNVHEILGSKLQNKSKITLLQLSNHTSGLMRLPANFIEAAPYKNIHQPYQNYTEELLLKALTSNLGQQYPGGTNYNYSNYGMGLLGYLLAKKNGSTYEELLQTTIFQPYGMSSSSTQVIDTQRLVMSYDNKQNILPLWDMNVLAPAGGIRSSVHDLALFAQQQLFSTDRAIEMMQEPTFTSSDKPQIAMGWHLIADNDNYFLFHNGATGGYSSCMVMDKKSKMAVVALTNIASVYEELGNLDQFCINLLKLLVDR